MVTVITPVAKKRYTLEEYFEMEEKALFKNEFYKGKLIPMPGGTLSHNRIKGNVYHSLRLLRTIHKLKIEVLDSDQKVYISSYDKVVYPDMSVIDGAPISYDSKKHSIINPTLIIEVLSKSTASYDRGLKFAQYQSIPTFIEYILVEQDVPMVEVRTKKGEDWITKTYVGLEDTVKLNSLNCEISMADIYENVEDLGDPTKEMEDE